MTFGSISLFLPLLRTDLDLTFSLAGGDVSFGVASIEESARATPGSSVPVFEVDDIAAPMATLTEPSGALIALIQRTVS